ncbi:hypothetical protein [Streptomonospora salina]|uniref:Uncharacterized protein n=1 Tax=Streptomonospora salina TaxID=104205 RepID=A0A841EAV0_9ACTN|nr:hypothetical protein [Streptomonospora salina]MBB6000116.1 hypothetical protein [Streptomonospora salina]
MNTSPHLCPGCGELAVADYNVFPPRMWHSDVQTWHCENCRLNLRRERTARGWSPWRPTR